jgi:hypothetical protein
MKRLEEDEQKRVLECAIIFLSTNGAVVTFQKNAWNGLKSESDISYSIEDTKKGKLLGSLKGMPNITLLGVPPTRLSGPCSKILRKLLTENFQVIDYERKSIDEKGQ